MDSSTTYLVLTNTEVHIHNGTNSTKNGTNSQDQDKNLNHSDITLNWYIITFVAISLIAFVVGMLIRTRQNRLKQQHKDNEYLAYFYSVHPHSKIYCKTSFDAHDNKKIVHTQFYESNGLHAGLRMIADMFETFNSFKSNRGCYNFDDHSNAIELASIKLVDKMENVQIVSTNLTVNETVNQISNDISRTKDISTKYKSTKSRSENTKAEPKDTELIEMDKKYVNPVQEAYALEMRRYLQKVYKTAAPPSEESYTTPPSDESVRENPLSNLVDGNTTYTRCGNKQTMVHHVDHVNHRNQVQITLNDIDMSQHTDETKKTANTWL